MRAHTVWLVARREIITRVRSRAYALGTLAAIIVMGGYAVLTLFLGHSTATVGFTGQSTAVAEPLERVAHSLGSPVETRDVPDLPSGASELREGELDALLSGAPDALTVTVRRDLDPTLKTALDTVVQQQALDAQLAQAGLTPADVHATVNGAHVAVTSLEPGDPQHAQRLALAMGAGVLLYFFLIIAGQAVAQGVVEEKSSRVVELLLSTIRPAELLAGKVIGIGLTALLQFAVLSGIGLAAALASGTTLPPVALAGTLMWAVLWFLLGFFFYATILAAAASLVSRQEELNNVVTPVIMALVVPFVIGLSLLPQNPENAVARVLSLLPGFGPVLMPMRIALNVAAPWEIALSLALTLAATAALLRLAGRIYSRAVLHTGARLKLTDAWGRRPTAG